MIFMKKKRKTHKKRDYEVLVYTILGVAALIGFSIFVLYIYGGM